MCCFSIMRPRFRLFAPKVHVSKTNIFARFTAPGVQALAYGMNLASSREVAMVLPLPVRRGAGEEAVRFVDLARHPRMFDELHALFPEFMVPVARSRDFSLSLPAPRPKLVVYEIGSFVASFVPTRDDFDRLDPRFRVPDVLFEAVPAYADHGFAVFQLKPGKVTVHPMAFTFRSRDADRLFFPTVHLHDGTWEEAARFDHALYYQRANGTTAGDEQTTTGSATYEGLLAARSPLQRRTLHGRLANEDTWIAAA